MNKSERTLGYADIDGVWGMPISMGYEKRLHVKTTHMNCKITPINRNT